MEMRFVRLSLSLLLVIFLGFDWTTAQFCTPSTCGSTIYCGGNCSSSMFDHVRPGWGDCILVKSLNFSIPSHCRQHGCNCGRNCDMHGDCCRDFFDVCLLPSLSSVTPTSVGTSGNFPITIRGRYFTIDGHSFNVTIDGNLCEAISHVPALLGEEELFECRVPIGHGSNRELRLTSSFRPEYAHATVSYIAPSIASMVPNIVSTDGSTRVVISGTNFGPSPVVRVDDVVVETTSVSDTHAVFSVPAGAGTLGHSVIVTAGDQNSLDFGFTYGAPTVMSITPSSSPTDANNATITVTGTNFGSNLEDITILFADVACEGGTTLDIAHVQTSCQIPSSVGLDKPVRVKVGNRVSNQVHLFAYEPPQVTGIQYQNGNAMPTAGGGIITVQGTNFGPSGSGVIVTIDGRPCSITSNTHTQIVCTSPSGEGTAASVQVSVGGQNSDATAFFASFLPPTVSSISPSNGATQGGFSVVVSGANFGVNGAVLIGGKECEVTVRSPAHDAITCSLPAGQGENLSVVVSAAEQTSVGNVFFSYDAPDVQSILPDAAPTEGGVEAVIAGTSLGISGEARIGDFVCTVSGSGFDHTSVTCRVPSIAEGGIGLDVSVQVPAGADGRTDTLSSVFSYSPPVITEASPSAIPTEGGTLVSLLGSSFGSTAGTVLHIDSNTSCAIEPNGWSHKVILCTMPAGRENGTIKLTTSAGQSSSFSGISYLPPQVDSIVPTSGDTNAAIDLTVSGSSFDSTAGTVTVDGKACTAPMTWSHTRIVCRLPPGAGLDRDVVVTSTLPTVHRSTTVSKAFSYAQATITAVSPTQCATNGTTSVLVSGTNFGPAGTSVRVLLNGGGQLLDGVALETPHTNIRFLCPSGSSNSRITGLHLEIAGQLSPAFDLSYVQPSLSSISPTELPTRADAVQLVISGSDFGDDIARVTVAVGGLACPLLMHSQQQLRCSSPGGQGVDVSVQVTVDSRSSNILFVSFSRPSITGFKSSSAPTAGGVPLEVMGSNLDTSRKVLVGGRDCPILTSNETVVTCNLPAGEGSSVQLTVATGTAFSNVLTFAYDAPVISAVLSPNGKGTDGVERITVTGSNFGVSGRVEIAGSICLGVSAVEAHTRIVCQLPEGKGLAQPLLVRVVDQTSASRAFDYDPPVISQASPTLLSTTGGEILVLDGSNFGSCSASIEIIGVGACAIIAGTLGHNSVQCTTPMGSGTNLTVRMSVSGQHANFSIAYAAPIISSITLSTSPLLPSTTGGASLILEGTNFGPAGIVTVDGVASSCVLSGSGYNNRRVECRLAAGVGSSLPIQLCTGAVFVHSQSQCAFAPGGGISYARPTITSATSSNGSTAAGSSNVLDVAGSNFGGIDVSVSVTVAGSACPIVAASVSHTSLKCLLPSGVGSQLPVVVSVAGQTSIEAGTFSYAPPTVSSIQGCSTNSATGTEDCHVNGGDVIVITGDNLGSEDTEIANVSISGLPCVLLSPPYIVAHRSLSCTVPANPTGGVSVSVVVEVGSQSDTVELLSYRSPQVVDGTLRLLNSSGDIISNQTIGAVVLDTTLSTLEQQYKLRFDAINLHDVITVEYGLPGVRLFSCTDAVVTSAGGALSTITCSASDAIGSDLNVRVNAGRQTSAFGTDTISHPIPTILAASIRMAGTTQRFSHLQVNSTEGQRITFDVRHVGSVPTGISVFYGPKGGGPYPFVCLDVSLRVVNVSLTELSCRTQHGTGSELSFVVDALNRRSEESSFTYSYPRPLVITRVTGCDLDDSLTNGTSLCPTKGGVTLTINGENFAPDVSTQIGEKACPLKTFVSSEVYECILPSGTGLDLQVVALSGSLFSRGRALLSYAAPTISSVKGCPTSGCPRRGNTTIVIEGTGFGASGARVAVGGSVCTSPTHNAVTPHEELSCIIPPGTGTKRTLIIFQDGGSFGFNASVVISYALCRPGEREDLFECKACGRGTFTGKMGARECIPCAPGTFTNATGSTHCEMCLPGQYDAVGGGASVCSPCPAGRASGSSGLIKCQVCEAGRYSDEPGRRTCKACPAGTQASEDRRSCVPCALGQFAASEASASCTAAATGHFVNSTGAVQASQCAAGRFQDLSGQASCKPCGLGTFTSAIGQVACTDCPSGRFANETEMLSCLPCQAGSWSSSKAINCLPCAEGSFASSLLQSQCLLCPQGRFVNERGATLCSLCEAGRASSTMGATKCSDCSAGQFSAAEGAVACQPCRSGRFASASAATACELCSAGRFSTPGATSCSRCPLGSATRHVGQASCQLCIDGTFANSTGSSSCTLCPEGSSSVGIVGISGPSSCEECRAGTFAAVPGQPSCTPCSPGSFQAKSGSTSCSVCPLNSVTDRVGQTVCSRCDAGDEASFTGAVACQSCSSGSFSSLFPAAAAVEGCSSCPSGRFSGLSSSSSCSECPAGRSSSARGSSKCSVCPSGSYTNTTSDKRSCLPCEAGRFTPLDGATECTACSAGRFASALGSSSCETCSPGTFSLEGFSVCSPCAGGRFSRLSASSSCSRCAPGSFSSTGASSCSLCPLGRFASSSGSSSCKACPAGSADGSAEGRTSCALCVAGRFTSANGSVACTSCPLGFFSASSGASSCTPCPLGEHQNQVGATACIQCELGRFSSSPASIECDLCGAGFVAASRGSLSCTPCPLGRAQPSKGKAECSACETGSANAFMARSSCSSCSAGRFSNATALTACTLCPPGRTSMASKGSRSCVECTAGRFASSSGSSTCLACAAGTFTPRRGSTACELCQRGEEATSTGSTACVQCQRGRFSSYLGTSACEQCRPGRFAQGIGLSACELCPKGSAQPNSGSVSCMRCSAGRFSHVSGLATCPICPAGRSSGSNLEGASYCPPCAPGRFQDGSSTSPTSCQVCDVGRHASTSGRAVCAPCAAGKFQNATAQSVCEDCRPGEFASSVGSSACQPCKVSTFADRLGMPSCKPCAPGYFQISEGSVKCDPCPIGTSSFGSNSTSCSPCSLGRFSADLGQEVCSLCPIGKFASSNGSTECESCQAGFFNDIPGASSCKPCARGTATALEGSAFCGMCPAGRFADVPQLLECKACRAGTYANKPIGSVGAETCLECPPGTYSSSGQSRCSRCLERQVTLVAGQERCFPCDANSKPTEFHDKCLCKPGYYANFSSNPLSLCTECSSGHACDREGITLLSLPVRPGYWRPRNTSARAYRCVHEKNCGGGALSECLGNHADRLCGICKETYYSTSRGNCHQCPDARNSWIYFISVVVLVLVLLWMQFLIVLRVGSGHIKHVKAKDIAEGYNDYWSQVVGVELANPQAHHASEEMRRQAARAIDASLNGTPSPKPNFTYKMKIVLGFLQVVTSLMIVIESPLPTTFKEFMSWFGLTNFDFFQASGTECIISSDFYSKYLVVALTPIFLIFLVCVFYLLPKYVGKSFQDRDPGAQKRSRRKFWRMLLFSLFLIYPGVSSVLFRLFVCTEIEGSYYLRSDLRVQCYTTKWYSYASSGGLFILLYPIGIPLFFAWMLYHYRFRLHEDGIKAELGFLYDAYEYDVWWFELVDMLHKLALSSLISFFSDLQLQAGAALSTVYIIVLLHVRPYKRKGDDRLHLLAQMQIIMLLIVGHTFKDRVGINSSVDIGLSIVLLIDFVVFIGIFAVQLGMVVRKLIHLRREKRKANEEGIEKEFQETRFIVNQNYLELEHTELMTPKATTFHMFAGSE